jgi:acyl-coenzyme A synthetase/AMP-(fatty) acid ligase
VSWGEEFNFYGGLYKKLYFSVRVLHPDGTQALPNELGRIVVKLPLPPGNMSTLYRNDEMFEKVYFNKYPVSPNKTWDK